MKILLSAIAGSMLRTVTLSAAAAAALLGQSNDVPVKAVNPLFVMGRGLGADTMPLNARLGQTISKSPSKAPAEASVNVTLSVSDALAKYLDLSADQRNKIQQNNQEVLQLVLTNTERQAELLASLEQELTKPQLDAVLIGQQYVELESLRRQMVVAETKARGTNVEVLTAPQKLLLKSFEDALRNSQLIDEASCQALLPPANELSATGGVAPGGGTGSNGNATQTPLCGLRYASFSAATFGIAKQ